MNRDYFSMIMVRTFPSGQNPCFVMGRPAGACIETRSEVPRAGGYFLSAPNRIPGGMAHRISPARFRMRGNAPSAEAPAMEVRSFRAARGRAKGFGPAVNGPSAKGGGVRHAGYRSATAASETGLLGHSFAG